MIPSYPLSHTFLPFYTQSYLLQFMSLIPSHPFLPPPTSLLQPTLFTLYCLLILSSLHPPCHPQFFSQTTLSSTSSLDSTSPPHFYIFFSLSTFVTPLSVVSPNPLCLYHLIFPSSCPQRPLPFSP